MAVASAGIIADHSVILQGPSTKTTLVGPDGTHISAHAPGGQVVHNVDVGFAAHSGHVHAAPIVAPVVHSVPVASVLSHVSHVAPIVAHAAPIVAHASPVVAHAVPVVAHVGPAVAHSSVSRVDKIVSTGVVSHVAPVVSHVSPVLVAHAGHDLIGHIGHDLVGHIGHDLVGHAGHDLVGLGHEGEYVHDYTETLYDDGSYKPGHYDEHHH